VKPILKGLAYISLITNIYVSSLWIYIYNTSNNYEDRKAKFNDSLPSFTSTTVFDILIVLLGIASVIYFATTDRASAYRLFSDSPFGSASLSD